jgi:hypothetical protein
MINQMDVVVVSQPCRKRENLLTMLESIDRLESVQTADSFNDLSNKMDPSNPVTVLIDYRQPEQQLDREVSSLIMNDAVEHIVLLQNRNAPKSHFTHYSTSELVYDELTVGILSNLLQTIALQTEY